MQHQGQGTWLSRVSLQLQGYCSSAVLKIHCSLCADHVQGPPKNAAKLSAARKAVGFDRTVDGRVLLFSDDGEPFQVKNDMGVPGALLLRYRGITRLLCVYACVICVHVWL